MRDRQGAAGWIVSRMPRACSTFVKVDSSGFPSAESDRYSASRVRPVLRASSDIPRARSVAERSGEYPEVFFKGCGCQIRGDICFVAQIFGRIEPPHAESLRDLGINLRIHFDFLAFFARAADLSSPAMRIARSLLDTPRPVAGSASPRMESLAHPKWSSG